MFLSPEGNGTEATTAENPFSLPVFHFQRLLKRHGNDVVSIARSADDKVYDIADAAANGCEAKSVF